MYTKVYCFGGIETYYRNQNTIINVYTKVYCFGGIETLILYNHFWSQTRVY